MSDFHINGPADTQNSVPDCVFFPDQASRSTRLWVTLAAVAAGGLLGLTLSPGHVLPLLLVAAFCGGVLSTWSPCGYSSISLLRPSGRGGRALLRFLPVFAVHGAGYALGALVLGSLLGLAGLAFGFGGTATLGALLTLGLTGLLYGLHQLDFIRMPYPQRRAQVPHDARQRFPKWVVSALYGFSLGLDYLTYVQTPILYLVTAAAVFSGALPEAILLIAVFNLGRYLPVAATLLPVSDAATQKWLSRHQETAAVVDGAILIAAGVCLGTLALL